MRPRIQSANNSSDSHATPKRAVPETANFSDLSGPRGRARFHTGSSPASLAREIADARTLLDRGMSNEAEARLREIVAVAVRHDTTLLAQARCLLSSSLEMQGRYREALEVVEMYETTEARAKLDAETVSGLRVQIGLVYSYVGDAPKAIAILNSALQRETASENTDALLGAIYNALSRVYRSINEYTIARDHANKALEHYRRTGDWRGLAEAYFGLALADLAEGHYEAALGNFEQAIHLAGDNPAPYLLGKIYNNMAGVCWFLKRPYDGIRYLEKSVKYYERTEHKVNAAIGYNNLGINLVLVGKWERAQDALKRALALANEVDENGAQVPTILESLGELRMLRGELVEAQELLERAVKLATQNGNKWYAAQAMRTLGRCLLAMNDTAGALVKGEGALGLGERLGDRQAIWESSVLLAEAYLQEGHVEECTKLLQKLSDDTAESETDLAIAGETQRLYGMLAMSQKDASLAVNHFGRSISMFEMLGDRYRTARAHYWLGCAYMIAAPERAEEHLALALHTFRELGARLDLARVEETLAAISHAAPERPVEPSAIAQLLTLRLAEAVASRELLLRELAAVIHQETDARRVLIVEDDEESRARVVIAHGCTAADSARLAEGLGQAKTEREREQFASDYEAQIIQLKAANAPPATVFIAPSAQSTLRGGASLEPLLRVVELGMDVCALRERTRTGKAAQSQDTLAGANVMPGFIHSSPAMTRLVDEVHKIRSSDVTVLVTGESGTGKELVARAIHALSSRRSKVFVPFNCTAVPKELAEGYLFGYRRGAFTGAVSDSAGVIRTAAGGTLFLDEIGDLPLDVQPKLLRFLQEGEIQPLGEQRPMKVDVRIIAATNTDLEGMVADGRFREDLYYRLNVIRLCVPPLRERRSEIPTIVNYYINHYSAKFGRHDIQMTPQTVDLLMVCDWPGNVRQLCNEIQRIVARAEDGTLITPEHLSTDLKRSSAPITLPTSNSYFSNINAVAEDAARQNLTLADAMAELERHMIAEALRKHNNNISRAARELGLTRRGLYLKLERYDMKASA
ncbi:MAG TPA: sigma 54-interacting transcriptional regulator [Pyrinomonadaceae bacterium]|jgi:transcriptional regulator with PAS, ATPase and Fis domain/Tfp pilus assembly protein PilF|nr:sigma 54-interacting transcriptional regulator [Pyrinomonadaceae bacterium]